MAQEHLSITVPLPETGGEHLSFRPENYFRSPQEIATSEQILREQLKVAEIERQRAEHQFDDEYGWLGKAGHFRLQGGLVGFVCGMAILLAMLTWLGWIAIR